MPWNINYNSLKEILPLEGNVISATYRDEPLEGGYVKPMRLCEAMGAARKGKIVNLDGPNQTCVGGLYYCGFHSEPYPGMIEFYAEKKHHDANTRAAEKEVLLERAILSKPAKYLIFAPPEKLPYEPDLIILTCLPYQAHMFISTYTYDSGIMKSSIITGPVCRSAITNPLLKGDLQIGLIDNGARKHAGFKSCEMIVTMPTRVFLTVLRNHEEKRKFGPPEKTPDFREIKEEFRVRA